MVKLTGGILMVIATTLTRVRANSLADLHNEICPAYKIDTADRMHEFLATEIHESGEFRYKVENLNYTVDRLPAVFGFFKKNPSLAPQYARNPEAIANVVYADKNRPKDARLGNVYDGDGWLFRGGGNIQITGRDMYTAYAKYKGEDVEKVAALVQSDDRWALDSACWVFAVQKQLLDEADNDQFTLITRRINGGLNGLEDRQKYLQRCIAAIK